MAFVYLVASVRNAMCDAAVDLIDGGAGAGYIEIYTGVAPTVIGGSITTQVLLGTLTFSDPAFGAATAGVATASAITSDTSADATGQATWARIYDSNATVLFDVDVGTSNATIILDDINITAGDTIAISSGTFTMPDGA